MNKNQPSRFRGMALGILTVLSLSSRAQFIISTYAGNGTSGLVNGAAASAQFNGTMGVGTDANGNVYVADNLNNVIRKINRYGYVSTLAGNGTAGYYGDGVLATTAEINAPAAW